MAMTRINKFKIRLSDGRIVTHPAFVRDGKEIECFYISDPMPLTDRSSVREVLEKHPNTHVWTWAEADALGRLERGDYIKE